IPNRRGGRLGFRHQLLLPHHGQWDPLPQHGELPGRPGKPDRYPAAHPRPAPGQSHQPPDEGHVLSFRCPHSRSAGRGGHRGVVAAAVSGGRIRPRLAAVWLVFFVLVGTIAVIEHTDLGRSTSGRDGDADPRRLLPVPVDQLGAIEVANAGTLYRFERDAAGAWFYHGVHTGSEGAHAHNADAAMAARIERAFAAFGRTRIERQFALKTPTGDYGTTTPETLILVYRPNDTQPLVQYEVGDIAPDTVSRYVLVVGSSTVATIPNYQIDNLLALIQTLGGNSEQQRAARSALGPPGPLSPPSPQGASINLVVDFACAVAVRDLLIRDDLFDVLGADYHTLARIEAPGFGGQFAFTPETRETRVTVGGAGEGGRGTLS